MPSFSHELRQAFFAGIQPCGSQYPIAGEQTSHAPLPNNESTRKKIFAACSLITYASPITLIALQGFDPKIRALQLTIWTLASLCIENTTEIIDQSFSLNMHSPTLSLIASQLEAQLLPLFMLQAALFIIFINQYRRINFHFI